MPTEYSVQLSDICVEFNLDRLITYYGSIQNHTFSHRGPLYTSALNKAKTIIRPYSKQSSQINANSTQIDPHVKQITTSANLLEQGFPDMPKPL